jgi:hypothetical protein
VVVPLVRHTPLFAGDSLPSFTISGIVISGITVSGIACPLAFSTGIMLLGFLFSGQNRIIYRHLLPIYAFFFSSEGMGDEAFPCDYSGAVLAE